MMEKEESGDRMLPSQSDGIQLGQYHPIGPFSAAIKDRGRAGHMTQRYKLALLQTERKKEMEGRKLGKKEQKINKNKKPK